MACSYLNTGKICYLIYEALSIMFLLSYQSSRKLALILQANLSCKLCCCWYQRNL